MADAEVTRPWRTRAVRLYTALKAGFVGRCTARAFEIQITDRMLALAAQALGEDWIAPETVRFGASSLLDALLER